MFPPRGQPLKGKKATGVYLPRSFWHAVRTHKCPALSSPALYSIAAHRVLRIVGTPESCLNRKARDNAYPWGVPAPPVQHVTDLETLVDSLCSSLVMPNTFSMTQPGVTSPLGHLGKSGDIWVVITGELGWVSAGT